MSNLKICHITSMHGWQDDRIFQRACVGLARKGHDVYLVAIGEKKEQQNLNSLNVKVHLLPTLSGWRRRIYGSRAVLRKATELKADVYQFHDPDMLPHLGILLKARPKSVVVYDIHENYAGRFVNWGFPVFFGNWFRAYEKKVINRLSGITVVSKSMEALFKEIEVPIEITRNSTDMERLKDLKLDEKNEQTTPIVITSGSHSHERHCLQTVQSIKYTENSRLSMPVFQFVGKYINGIEDEMNKQADEDEVLEHLSLDGMLPWEQNFERIAQAFCGCVFYKDNVNNRVGIPNRIFEYMYCGIPVLVSDFPELRNVVETANCGIVVDSESPVDIARGIVELLKDVENAKKMGNNGYTALKENYGYHIDLDKLEAFYYRMLKNSL